MGHTYHCGLYHIIFSTKNRHKTIDAQLEEQLWPYLGGIARDNKMRALAVGGVSDHVHLLLSLPTTLSVSHAVQLIKGGSSKWIHDTFPHLSAFAWQEGYGAFSIGISHVDKTAAYIKNQPEHHRKKSFEEEFTSFLKRHGMEFDLKYVWG